MQSTRSAAAKHPDRGMALRPLSAPTGRLARTINEDTMDSTPEKPVILLVDDTPANLAMMSELLMKRYKVKAVNQGEKALQIARQTPTPDLILLDIMMPGMNGFEVCRQLKADAGTRDIPVIFLTAMSQADEEEIGFGLGAVDYITKPISPPIVLARVQTHLTLKQSADFLRDQNDYLEQEIERRSRELQTIQDVTIMTMASLAETRDNDTGNHIRRTQFYVSALARKLASHPRHSPALTPQAIDTLFKSAPLHDIGKVGIPDHILLKPGKLDSAEFDIMKTHTTLGRQAIEHAEAQLGVHVDFLACAKEIATWHHEKWNGSGYPDQLAGEAIPLVARIMAIADVYDALISRRVYKAAMPHEQAVAIIRADRGLAFDPDLVDAFVDIHEEFRTIARQHQDSDDDILALARRSESAEHHRGTSFS